MIVFVLWSLFLIAMFFAWAIGGEKYFGKWRRGALVAIPMTTVTLLSPGGIIWAILGLPLLWAIYQSLKYDEGIEMVFVKKNWRGWIIIGANGFIIGLTPISLAFATSNIVLAAVGILAGILGFASIVLLSNNKVYSSAAWRMWLVKNMPTKRVYLKYITIDLQNAWYVSSGIMGAILGLVVILFK